jgi:multidrug efflux pump subunit AcrA (membrane-fusion protein)
MPHRPVDATPLGEASVDAPLDGAVTDGAAEPGAVVAAGEHAPNTIMTLTARDPSAVPRAILALRSRTGNSPPLCRLD